MCSPEDRQKKTAGHTSYSNHASPDHNSTALRSVIGNLRTAPADNFQESLAGPSILGISSGASLGVAIVTLLGGGVLSVVTAAFGGAMVIIALLIAIAAVVRSNMTLLIVE